MSMHILDISHRCMIVNEFDRPFYGLCAIEYCGQALYLIDSPHRLSYRLPLNDATPIGKFGVQVTVDRSIHKYRCEQVAFSVATYPDGTARLWQGRDEGWHDLRQDIEDLLNG